MHFKAVCLSRNVEGRGSLWSVNDQQCFYVEQHRSPEPWHLMRQQRSFCTVHECYTDGTPTGKNIDMATSDHGEAIRMMLASVHRNANVEVSYNV